MERDTIKRLDCDIPKSVYVLLLVLSLTLNTTVWAQFQFGPTQPTDQSTDPLKKNSDNSTLGKSQSGSTTTGLGSSSSSSHSSSSSKKKGKKDTKETVEEQRGKNGPKFGTVARTSWKTGVRLHARDECSDMLFLIPIPLNWPEQKVMIVEETSSSSLAHVARRDYSTGGLRQMVVSVPKLGANRSVEAALTVEVARAEILPPNPESIPKLSLPKKLSGDFDPYLKKSPQIESDAKVFRDLFQQITKDISGDWNKMEAVYKYVQDSIVYDEANKAKIGNTALETIKLKRGDCKEMTAVFIAICRAGKVPARTVWVPGHCYAEFYMIDDENDGYWFPCQVSGTYSFGGIPETGPVLQKGDNFSFKEFPGEKYRFVERLVVGQHPENGVPPKCDFFEDKIY